MEAVVPWTTHSRPFPDSSTARAATVAPPTPDPAEPRAVLRADAPGVVADLVGLGFGARPAAALVGNGTNGGPHRLFHWSGGTTPLVVEDLGGVPLSDAGLGRRLSSSWAAGLSIGRLRHVEEGRLQPGAPVRVLQQVTHPDHCSGYSRPDVLTALRSRHADGGDRILVLADSEGRQADVLLRMLGLPTTDPQAPPVWFWLVAWLVEAVIGGAATDLRRVAARHPAVDPSELSFVPADELTDFIVQRHRDHVAATGWSGLRCTAMDGGLDLGSVDPALAAWLDDGSFARLIDGRLGTPADLARLVNRSFPSTVVEALGRIVGRLDPATGRSEP